jgi:hypothetical protein
MSAHSLRSHAAQVIRRLRKAGLRTQARNVAFDLQREIGAAQLRRSVA